MGHGNFQNPICAAELELGEIGSGLGICLVHKQRERKRRGENLLTSVPTTWVSHVLRCVSDITYNTFIMLCEMLQQSHISFQPPGHPVTT